MCILRKSCVLPRDREAGTKILFYVVSRMIDHESEFSLRCFRLCSIRGFKRKGVFQADTRIRKVKTLKFYVVRTIGGD